VGQLATSLTKLVQTEGQQIDLMISHYWDAARVAELFREDQGASIPHVWVPHSLGEIKKRNIAPDQWASLRIDERIQTEHELLSKITQVASTSPIITQSLQQDYDYEGQVLWLPPCISTSRYHPREVFEQDEVWEVLGRATNLSVQGIKGRKIVMEVSRTDSTKRKDVLLKAFAKILAAHPDTLLVVTIDQRQPLAADLESLIDSLNIRDSVLVLGSIWDVLPQIYAIADIYCTPSVMEGFGMSAQEAAATGKPVVASKLVPFATQYLYAAPLEEYPTGENQTISVGRGAIIVEPDRVDAFAEALDRLLGDDQLREGMGKRAYEITIPRFTWPYIVEQFLEEIRAGAS
jgi:glycosyltransferase involved in cell wall biosynthesis